MKVTRGARLGGWLLAAALGGCAAPSEPAAGAATGAVTGAAQGAAVDAAHNSRNALDWAGTYEGVLPCADCPGIKTRLVLHSDGRFDLSTQYLERQPAPESVSGRFSWNSAGSGITLDAAGSGQQFQVGVGRLLQVNRDGSVPPWNSPHRLLNKVAPPK